MTEESAPEPPVPERPTFYAHVAPILIRHCLPCHGPDGGSGLPLARYPDAAAHASQIAEAVAEGRMPPWLPESGLVEYANERRLRPREVEILRRWAAAGAPEGEPAPEPQAAHASPGQWELGPPDLVVEMREPYTLPPEGPDRFRNFVVPAPVAAPRYVRAVDLAFEGAAVVHHAQVLLDPTGAARELDARDPEPGFDGMDAVPAAQNPDGFFVGWSPGHRPAPPADDLAWRLEPGTDFVLMLHLMPRDRPERVRARLALYFADRSPERAPVLVRMGAQAFEIPPGARDYPVEDRYRLPVDVDALLLYPHAHRRAREMRVYAVTPDGQTRWLLRIPRWDFRWQDEYRLARPIHLPAGTEIVMRYTYENPDDRPIRYGPRTSDEMAELLVQVVPRRAADRDALVLDLARAYLEDRIERYRFELRLDPANPDAHYGLGTALAEAGQPEAALRHLRAALDAGHDDPGLHANLGSVLQSLGRVDEAIGHYRRALALDPRHAGARYNLGTALQARGDFAGAAHAYRAVLDVRPDHAPAHHALGLALARLGDARGAVRHLREAARLAPDWVPPLAALAWTLATHPDPGVRDPAEALARAERAFELTGGRDPVVLDALAAAHARAGRADLAVQYAEDALALARAAGAVLLENQIRRHLDLYRRGEPVTEAPAARP